MKVAKKRKHAAIAPAPTRQYSKYELFGTDSEDDSDDDTSSQEGKKYYNNMFCYFIQKYPKVYSQQINKSNIGEYYITLKITFNIDTKESNDQLKLVRLADLIIKNMTNSDTEAWLHLIKFIRASKRQINQCVAFFEYNPICFYSFQDPAPALKKPRPVSSNKGEMKKMKTEKKEKSKTASKRTSSVVQEPIVKASANDVFGSDSDDEQFKQAMRKPGKTLPKITSYFTKRIPQGVTRQSDPDKEGSHFVELKVYRCDEIRKVQPMNRWRHAIITIKNQSDVDTEAWTHLTQFIKATRQEFKYCRPDIISGNAHTN